MSRHYVYMFICMSSQCHYFPCHPFVQPCMMHFIKFERFFVIECFIKSFLFVSNFFCICTILWQDDDIFIFLIKILRTLKFSFGTFTVCKHANFVLQLYSHTLNLSLTIDWLLMDYYYYYYYFANNNPKVMIVYMWKLSQPLGL